MGAFRRQRNLCLVFALVAVSLALWSWFESRIVAACVFLVLSTALFVLLFKLNRAYSAAQLIWHNKILVTPTAVVRTEQGAKTVAETIVSAFGLLVAGRIYAWGNRGLIGPRLKAVELDRLHIRLTFGDTRRATQVELLHGLTEKNMVENVQYLLWRETGVTAEVINW